MKYILRVAVGVVFTFFLLLLLFVGAVKFQLLSAKFWAAGVERSGLYQELLSGVDNLQRELDQKPGGRKIVLREVITEARVRQVVEMNVTRLVDYLNGKTERLALWLPLTEWNLPKEVISGLPKLPWSTEMDVEKILPAFGFPPDQAAMVVKNLSQIQTASTWLPGVWVALLLVTLFLLTGHYLLGDGKKDRIKGVAILLLGSGLVTTIIGWGGGTLGELIAKGATNLPVFARTLIAGWLAEFFALGRVFGLVIAAVGLALFIWITYVAKQPKVKELKPQEGLAKKLFQTLAGIALGVILIAGGLLLLVVSLGGQVTVKVNP